MVVVGKKPVNEDVNTRKQPDAVGFKYKQE